MRRYDFITIIFHESLFLCLITYLFQQHIFILAKLCNKKNFKNLEQ